MAPCKETARNSEEGSQQFQRRDSSASESCLKIIAAAEAYAPSRSRRQKAQNGVRGQLAGGTHAFVGALPEVEVPRGAVGLRVLGDPPRVARVLDPRDAAGVEPPLLSALAGPARLDNGDLLVREVLLCAVAHALESLSSAKN